MKTLIIPDVHGRKFWREPVKEWLGIGEPGRIVFLGDYVDPYEHEGIRDDQALEELRAIIAVKRQYPEKVILLMGNHDREYYSSLMHEIAGGGRYCRSLAYEIKNVLRNNYDLFQLAYEETQAGRRYLFTHAALNPEWLRIPRNMELISEDVVSADELNRLYPSSVENDIALSCVSPIRGGTDDAGSILWADAREILGIKAMPDKIYNIFGHTQVEEPIITENWACLDARTAFVLENGYICLAIEKQVEQV